MKKRKIVRRKPKTVDFYIPLYKAKITIWICSRKEAASYYKDTEYSKRNYTWDISNSDGNTLYGEGLNPIIWIQPNSSKADLIAALAHELLHAINHILSARGLVFKEYDDEAYTYFLEYMLAQALPVFGLTK